MSAALALVLAEPEPETRGFLERNLSEDGFVVLGAEGGGEALELAEQAKPDLVLLGSKLRDSSGFELCARLRAGEPGRSWNRDVPVILLGNGDGDAVERVRAFDRGCDDYLSRPIVYEELVARIRAIMRRVSPPAGERIEVGELVVDKRTRGVTLAGAPVPVSGKEFELLVKLASDPPRVFTKEELLREVWGYRSLGSKRPIYPTSTRRSWCLAARACLEWQRAGRSGVQCPARPWCYPGSWYASRRDVPASTENGPALRPSQRNRTRGPSGPEQTERRTVRASDSSGGKARPGRPRAPGRRPTPRNDGDGRNAATLLPLTGSSAPRNLPARSGSGSEKKTVP